MRTEVAGGWGLAWHAHYEIGPPLRAPSTALSLSSSSRCCCPPPCLQPWTRPPCLALLACLFVLPRTPHNRERATHLGMQHWGCSKRSYSCTCGRSAGGGGAVDRHRRGGGAGLGFVSQRQGWVGLVGIIKPRRREAAWIRGGGGHLLAGCTDHRAKLVSSGCGGC